MRGHGVRDRVLHGPPDAWAEPVLVVVVVRRYRCGRCRAVITVVPRGVVRRRRFSASAIGWALALFGLCDLDVAQIRRRVSPRPAETVSGNQTTWAQLRRWARAVRARRLFPVVRAPPLRFTLREVAARAATTLAALAPPALRHEPLDVRTFFGAALAA